MIVEHKKNGRHECRPFESLNPVDQTGRNYRIPSTSASQREERSEAPTMPERIQGVTMNIAKNTDVVNSPYAQIGAKLIEQGYSAIPIEKGTKKPLTNWKEFQSRLPNEHEIETWSNGAGYGVGVVCGKASGGLIAIDIDDESVEAAIRDVLLKTTVEKKGAKGVTLFFQATEPLKSKKWKIDSKNVVELLSDGNQTVLPPSIHPDTGSLYQWTGLDSLERLLPSELPELTSDHVTQISAALKPFGYQEKPAPAAVEPRQEASHEVGASECAYALKALEGCYNELEGAPEGGRNDKLNAIAYHMGGMVGAEWIERGEVEAALWRTCEANGLVRDDGANSVHATIKSGLDSGVLNPHEPLAERQGVVVEFPGTKNPLHGFVFDDDTAIEMPDYLVKGILPAKGVAFVGGQSGAGKSFIALNLAVCLASGIPFFGRRIKENIGVAILAAEGAGSYKIRLRVARRHAVGDEKLPICYLGAVPDLKNKKEIDALVPRLLAVEQHFRQTHDVRLGAVIIDTVAAAFDLDDENDNSEAARTIRVIKELGQRVNALMIPIHHYGKAPTTGLRGASGWKAGCDAVLSVLAERNEITGQVSG